MRVKADNERCVGAGSCVMSAPKVFDQDESGLVVVLDESPGVESRSPVQMAVALCPAAALQMIED